MVPHLSHSKNTLSFIRLHRIFIICLPSDLLPFSSTLLSVTMVSLMFPTYDRHPLGTVALSALPSEYLLGLLPYLLQTSSFLSVLFQWGYPWHRFSNYHSHPTPGTEFSLEKEIKKSLFYLHIYYVSLKLKWELHKGRSFCVFFYILHP